MDNFSETQKRVVREIEEGKNIAYLGPGGCGKSHVVRYLAEKPGTTVCAHQGVAAVNCDGVTLYSLFGMRKYTNMEEPEEHAEEMSESKREILSNTTLLIIDEISMVSKHVLDFVDAVLGSIKGNDKLFGGIVLLVTGDFRQLAPVGDGASGFCFHSALFDHLEIIKSPDRFRQQSDQEFSENLEQIRSGNKKGFKRIFQRSDKFDILPVHAMEGKITMLSYLNKPVNDFNAACMALIHEEEHEYEVTTKVRLTPYQLLEVIGNTKLNIEPTTKLKKGAYVRCLVNNRSSGYVNGTEGIITRLTRACVTILSNDGKTIPIKYARESGWCKSRKEYLKIQYIPIKPAYASTIHKAQGLTMHKIHLDVDSIKRSKPKDALLYVALSRVKNNADLSFPTNVRLSCLEQCSVFSVDTDDYI